MTRTICGIGVLGPIGSAGGRQQEEYDQLVMDMAERASPAAYRETENWSGEPTPAPLLRLPVLPKILPMA